MCDDASCPPSSFTTRFKSLSAASVSSICNGQRGAVRLYVCSREGGRVGERGVTPQCTVRPPGLEGAHRALEKSFRLDMTRRVSAQRCMYDDLCGAWMDRAWHAATASLRMLTASWKFPPSIFSFAAARYSCEVRVDASYRCSSSLPPEA